MTPRIALPVTPIFPVAAAPGVLSLIDEYEVARDAGPDRQRPAALRLAKRLLSVGITEHHDRVYGASASGELWRRVSVKCPHPKARPPLVLYTDADGPAGKARHCNDEADPGIRVVKMPRRPRWNAGPR